MGHFHRPCLIFYIYTKARGDYLVLSRRRSILAIIALLVLSFSWGFSFHTLECGRCSGNPCDDKQDALPSAPQESRFNPMMQLAIASGLSFSGLLRRQASSSSHKLHITGHIFPRGARHCDDIASVRDLIRENMQGDGGCDVHKLGLLRLPRLIGTYPPSCFLHPIFPTMCPRGSTGRFIDTSEAINIIARYRVRKMRINRLQLTLYLLASVSIAEPSFAQQNVSQSCDVAVGGGLLAKAAP